MEFKHVQLDNGLTIIAEINPAAASMAVGFFARTGSRDETPKIAGVSHFLEHMVFKGTDKRSVFDVNREFDEMGASYNAGTSEETTVYYLGVLPEFQARALDLLCDIMRPALRQEDFDVEKGVIQEEIALYEDQPKFRVYDNLMSTHFAGHPLGNEILGTVESIQAMELADMRAYFDSRYSPTNLTVVATGNLDFDALLAKLQALCGHWQTYEVTRPTDRAKANATQKIITDAKVMREHIGLMSAGPTAMDEDKYAARLVASIIGDTTGSRLYYALVDQAIADEASTSFAALDGEGVFMTFISADADRAAEALQIARDELAKFAADGPTAAELTAAKNKIASGATTSGELPLGRMSELGREWMYCGKYIPLAEHIEKLFDVTEGDIAKLVGKYDLSATTTLGLGPLEKL